MMNTIFLLISRNAQKVCSCSVVKLYLVKHIKIFIWVEHLFDQKSEYVITSVWTSISSNILAKRTEDEY